MCDEFTRENAALEVERTMTAGDVVRILDQAVRERGVAPEFIRSDNSPEFIVKAVEDWISLRGFKTFFIEPGSPLAERLQRELQQPFPRRVPQW